VKPGQKLRTRSCLSLVTLGVMLLGCNTSATSPSEGVPTRSLGPAAATDLPLDKPPPTRHTNSVVPDEANSIYFAGRATRIDPAGQGKLRLHAARLKENPEQVVSLAVYTYGQGSDSYNLALADQRLEAVAKLLRNYGVPKKQIHPLRRYGVGPEGSKPACRMADCRRIGRVELIYTTR
jgi:outer membrane protein OmpA-like peptidoglycan-associated protein